MKTLILILSVLSSTLAFSKIQVLPPLKVENDIPAWSAAFAKKVETMKADGNYPQEGYQECREVLEIDGAFLCQSNSDKEMNLGLGRASFFIEGLGDPTSKGKVKRLDDSLYRRYIQLIGGHDLRGADLLRFRNAVNEACASSDQDPKLCFNQQEKDVFENFILPKTKDVENFVVITFANKSNMGWRSVVTHEIMHAQYFNQIKYRTLVDEFWENRVSDSDKELVLEILGRDYDASDALLMKNEFQAYLLIANADRNQLASLVPVYREELMRTLLENGVQPVQVK